MTQWYFSVNNPESAPFSTEIAKAFVRENPGAYCWRDGWSAWQPVHQVPEIRRMKKDGVTPPAPAHEGMSPRPSALPAPARRGVRGAPDSLGQIVGF
ncbi:MAG: DUF4339 domain-containing protein [Methylococcales bacterium]